MKKKNTEKLEKATIKDNFWALEDVKIPYIFLAGVLIAALISTYAGINIAFFTGDMVDASGNVPLRKLMKYVVSYLLIGLGTALDTLFIAQAVQRINLALRTKLWKKIIYTNQQQYKDTSAEDLISRVTSDCDFASTVVTNLISFGSVVISFVIYVIKMFKLNSTIALAVMIIIPISIAFGYAYSKFRFKVGQKTQMSLAKTTTYLVERTKNLNLIKTSNAQKKEMEKGLEAFDEQYANEIKTGILDTVYIASQHFYSIICILIPFVIGAKMVNDRVIRAGVVIAFYTLASQAGTTATNIINEIGTIRNANGAMARVISVLKLKDERDATGEKMSDTDKDITIKNLSFAYNDEKKVLKNINALIPNKKVTVVLGANGSGKTTLFKLIDRLLVPSDGQILFGDRKAEEFDVRSWRKSICLVAQDSPMLEGTIRENICYGTEGEISEERLIDVAKKARVYDFVQKLPDGFDTVLVNGAENLSGGQKQCVAIARAIMNDPKYLLLDEATSNLDSESENMVVEALEELMKERTTVIIAHSVATIRNADNVIVLNDGEITDTGSPKEILQKADNYLNKVVNRHAAIN